MLTLLHVSGNTGNSKVWSLASSRSIQRADLGPGHWILVFLGFNPFYWYKEMAVFREHHFVFLLSYYETEIISPGDHSCLQHDFIIWCSIFHRPPSDIWSNRLVRLWKKSSAIIWYAWMKKFSDMHVGSIPSGCGLLVENFNFFSGKPDFLELYEVFLQGPWCVFFI